MAFRSYRFDLAIYERLTIYKRITIYKYRDDHYRVRNHVSWHNTVLSVSLIRSEPTSVKILSG